MNSVVHEGVTQADKKQYAKITMRRSAKSPQYFAPALKVRVLPNFVKPRVVCESESKRKRSEEMQRHERQSARCKTSWVREGKTNAGEGAQYTGVRVPDPKRLTIAHKVSCNRAPGVNVECVERRRTGEGRTGEGKRPIASRVRAPKFNDYSPSQSCVLASVWGKTLEKPLVMKDGQTVTVEVHCYRTRNCSCSLGARRRGGW
ncbi:hypothetical protein R3P38DRAFT_2783336 [Favolaschia claudopus]|uniref:Uncharacterized protein n=1 Tax=Favolaschia claudopus TaxID=2862362 RepID=A0AAW0B159_9AGAR